VCQEQRRKESCCLPGAGRDVSPDPTGSSPDYRQSSGLPQASRLFLHREIDKSKTGMSSEGSSVSTRKGIWHSTPQNLTTMSDWICRSKLLQSFFPHSFPKSHLALNMSIDAKQNHPGLSSENFLMFMVALICLGSSSGFQLSLPTQHIPLSPCIRVCYGQGCVCSFMFLISSCMSHLLSLCSGRVLQGMRGHLIRLALYQTSWSNLEPESLFFPNCTSPLVTKMQSEDICPLLSSPHREHPL